MGVYCIKCGVKLADTEKKCPLCETVVCHPDYPRDENQNLYPSEKRPPDTAESKALNGAIIILFLIPLILCFFGDILPDGQMNWFGYAVSAEVVAYVAMALPLWFRKPNPVILVPCNFASTVLYLLYIDLVSGGKWFMSFAFPVVGGLCLIISTMVTLLYYLRRGRLYVLAGTFMALGSFMLLIEFLMGITFGMRFIGWSIYPLVILMMTGGLLMYFAISQSAREVIKRKLFF